jgi:hypothetical protein
MLDLSNTNVVSDGDDGIISDVIAKWTLHFLTPTTKSILTPMEKNTERR